jgi:hypothetical protein
MKSINQFAEGRSRTSCTLKGINASRHSNVPVRQIAEQRLQEKMQDNGLERSEQTVREPQASPEGMPLRSRAQTGRGPENGGKTRRPWMAEGDSRKADPSGREAWRAQRNAENLEVKEKRDVTSFQKRE